MKLGFLATRVTYVALVASIAGCGSASVRRKTGLPPRPAEITAAEEGFITTSDGVRLFYRKIGSAGDVVLVPGRLFLADDFSRLAARDRTLIFYDMRNRGRSDAVRDTLAITIQKDVSDLDEVRRYFRAERVSLVGYSYLGLMVVMYALEHPASVARLVQIGPVPRKFGTKYAVELTANDRIPVLDSASVARVRAMRESGYDATHPREYCQLEWSTTRFVLVGDPANVAKLGPGWCDMPNEHPINLRRHFQYHFTSVQRLTVPAAAVRRVDAPVLTIHGTKDRNADYGSGREWAGTLPNARLLTIPGAAHHLWVEAPDLVFPAVDAFLRGRWPPGAERVEMAPSAE